MEKKSKILDCTDEILSEILPDITLIDYKSKEYYRKIKDTKLNMNPILTGNKIKDTLKIKRLYAKYFKWRAQGALVRRIPKGFKTTLKKLLGK